MIQQFAETLRNAAEGKNVRPLLFEGFQPQLENQSKLLNRIAASGASHVFIASDRANISQIAAEAKATNLNLTIAGPETLLAAELDRPLPEGVLMVARDNVLNSNAVQRRGLTIVKSFLSN